MQSNPKLPDRTGVLILPGSLFFATVILSIILVVNAVQMSSGTYEKPRYTKATNRVVGEMVESLARALGVVPSIVVSVVLVAGLGVWLWRTIGTYRKLVAEDRKAAGL